MPAGTGIRAMFHVDMGYGGEGLLGSHGCVEVPAMVRHGGWSGQLFTLQYIAFVHFFCQLGRTVLGGSSAISLGHPDVGGGSGPVKL